MRIRCVTRNDLFFNWVRKCRVFAYYCEIGTIKLQEAPRKGCKTHLKSNHNHGVVVVLLDLNVLTISAEL